MASTTRAPAFGASRRGRGGARFVTRAGLGMSAPPAKPPAPAKFGSYCFRATCEVVDEGLGCPVAKVKGYDTSPTIGEDTEYACSMHARELRRDRADGGPGIACTPAEVVLLPKAPNMECSGQVFVVMEGEVKRLF